MGFEPTSTNTLELESSPLDRSGTNAINFGSVPGFEPGTSCTQSRNHTTRPNGQSAHAPRRGIEPRSPAWQAGILATILSRISPISLNAAGFEPTTFGFGIQCSANWATHPRWSQILTMETHNFPTGVPATILSGRTILHLWNRHIKDLRQISM